MNLKAIFKGFAVSALITLITIFATAALLYFTDITESAAGIAVYVGTALGVILGSIATAKAAAKKVLINCLMLAIVYLCIMVLTTLFVKGEISLTYHFIAVIAAVLSCAVFGAIIGRAKT